MRFQNKRTGALPKCLCCRWRTAHRFDLADDVKGYHDYCDVCLAVAAAEEARVAKLGTRQAQKLQV